MSEKDNYHLFSDQDSMPLDKVFSVDLDWEGFTCFYLLKIPRAISPSKCICMTINEFQGLQMNSCNDLYSDIIALRHICGYL